MADTATPKATAVETPKESEAKRQVTTTISEADWAKLSDIRWSDRDDKLTDTVRRAVLEFIAKHGK